MAWGDSDGVEVALERDGFKRRRVGIAFTLTSVGIVALLVAFAVYADYQSRTPWGTSPLTALTSAITGPAGSDSGSLAGAPDVTNPASSDVPPIEERQLAAAATPGANDANAPEVWLLSESVVVEEGETVELPDGTYLSGRVVECAADSDGEQATFRVTLSAFSPNTDMPGQSAGTWYLRGSWELSSAGSEGRHGALLGGTLSAELDDDTPRGDLAASVQVPASISAAGYARGEGEFLGTDEFEGRLELSLERRETGT